MARPRKDLGPGADDRIVAAMAKGLRAETIAEELGVSRATAIRRMRELRGRLTVDRAKRAKAPAPLPETPADIPGDTNLEQIAMWLATAKREADAAQVAGETDVMMKMIRLASQLLTLQTKATPPPPPDPNANPDFIALAEHGRQLLADLAEKFR